jgi:homoserine dehydrogenase
MQKLNLCLLGFGNVGRALARLFMSKSNELREQYGIEWQITGVASRRIGWLANANGFDVARLMTIDPAPSLANEPYGSSLRGISEWLDASKPDILFETTSLNPETGQPGIDHVRAGLQAGAHVVTANKGPVVHGYEELSQLAKAVGRMFLFESSVLDSAPVFSLFRETLPAVKLRSVTGVFNSTTNVILETMEAGRSFDEGVRAAQELGVAETDPSFDVDGWDSTMKVCAVARVLMKHPLRPAEVKREGIRTLTPAMLQKARADAKPFKLLSRLRVNEDGQIAASVRPEQVALTEPFGGVRGTSLAIHFELDVIPGLTVISHRPNLQSTAYGLLADFLSIVRTDGPVGPQQSNNNLTSPR